MNTTHPFDTAGLVRRARRVADISQRELADLIGLSQATVGRIEVGRPVATDLFVRILSVAGLRLQVVDAAGRPVGPMRADAVRDRGHRLHPAHLDPRPVTFWWNRAPFRERDHERGRPNALYGRRPDRPDPRRQESARADDHPTPAELVAWRRRMRPGE